jgi:hypothetical protein
VYSLLGVNQASAVVIAYFVETYRLSVERASLVIAMKRLVKPNDFLLKQLIRLSDETLHKPSKTDRISSNRFANVLNFVNGIGTRRPVPLANNARMIILNLFVGTHDVATDVVQMGKNRITRLLDLDGRDYNDARYREVGIEVTSIGPYRHVSYDLESLIEICVSFVGDCLKNGERLLLVRKENQCLADVVMAAYIMESHDVSVEEALMATIERRCVYIGVNYVQFLFYYEEKLRRRKQKIMQQITEDAFYFPNCDKHIQQYIQNMSTNPKQLCFLRVSMETSV